MDKTIALVVVLAIAVAVASGSGELISEVSAWLSPLSAIK